MADREAQQVTSAGIEPTAHAASGGGDSVPVDTMLRATNGGGAPITLTVVTHGVIDGDLPIDDREIAIPAGESRYVRVPRTYRNPATGRADLTWSGITTVTFEVIN